MKKDFSIRTIDNVGRIVVPMDFRKSLDIHEWDELRLFRDHERIVIEKNKPTCTFCQSSKDLVTFREKYICKKCYAELKG